MSFVLKKLLLALLLLKPFAAFSRNKTSGRAELRKRSGKSRATLFKRKDSIGALFF